MAFVIKKTIFVLFLLSTFSSFSDDRDKLPIPSSYWSFQNSFVYYSYHFSDDSYEVRGSAYRSSLSYSYLIKNFALDFSISLLLGPYTKEKRNNFSLDYMGFSGAFTFFYFPKFSPIGKNFSIASFVAISELSSSSSDKESFDIKLKNSLGRAGEDAFYQMKLRVYSLGFLLSYHFPKIFQKILEKERDHYFSYGHSFSLGFSLPVYGKLKKRFFRFTGPDTYEELKISERVKGFELFISYSLMFL